MEQSLQGFILKKGKKTKGKKQMLTITKDLFQKVSNMILKGAYLFQIFWKPHCCPKFLIFVQQTLNFGRMNDLRSPLHFFNILQVQLLRQSGQ